MTTQITGFTLDLLPGKVYWLCNYDGVCDLCGERLLWDNIPVEFVGFYNDIRENRYGQFENCFYLKCPGCGNFKTQISLFIDQTADKFSLFAKVPR